MLVLKKEILPSYFFLSAAFFFKALHVCFNRWKWRPMSNPGFLHPSQLVSVRSWLVSASPERPSTLHSSYRNTSYHHPRRAQRPPQDPVRIPDCQLRHLTGGRVWTLHPWSHRRCLGSGSRPQRRRRLRLVILPAGILLLLRPHAARVEMGLESRDWGTIRKDRAYSLFLSGHFLNAHRTMGSFENRQGILGTKQIL